MNWNKFEKWTKNQLKPNLQPHYVLVVDNASYHNTRAITISEPTMLQVKLIRFSGREIGNVAHDADQEARKLIRDEEGNEEIFNRNKN
jgi:hypothetical protein